MYRFKTNAHRPVSQRWLMPIFFFLSCLLTFRSSATVLTAIANNDWSKSEAWSESRIPDCGDTVIIPSGFIITVNKRQLDYTSCSNPLTVYISGTLSFVNGFKLKLPCNSVIYLLAGGIIESGNGGGGSDNLIEICNNGVWKTSCGSLFGPLTIPPYDCDALPVELVSFNAKMSGSVCLLSWTTASEINNDYFSIERSNDGNVFGEAGKVKGAGTSAATRVYSFIDEKPCMTISYYRLRQVDYDGVAAYSSVVAVHNLPQNFSILYVSADADNRSLLIQTAGKTEGQIQYLISDAPGKTLLSGSINSVSDYGTIRIYLPDLPRGIYYLSLKSADGMVCKKFLY